MIFHCFESMRGNVFSSFCAVLMTHYRPEKIDQTFRSMNVGTKTSAACDILTKLLVVVYLVSFSLQSAVRTLLKPDGFNASSFQTRPKAQKAHFFCVSLCSKGSNINNEGMKPSLQPKAAVISLLVIMPWF